MGKSIRLFAAEIDSFKEWFDEAKKIYTESDDAGKRYFDTMRLFYKDRYTHSPVLYKYKFTRDFCEVIPDISEQTVKSWVSNKGLGIEPEQLILVHCLITAMDETPLLA